MADSKSDFAASAHSLKELDAGIARCRACPLWDRATQAVCGEGIAKARIIWSASHLAHPLRRPRTGF